MRPHSLDISRDGFMLAHANGVFIEIMDILLAEPQHIRTFFHGSGITPVSVSFSPDGSTLAEASSTGEISLHGLRHNDDTSLELGRHDGRAHSVRISEDGRTVISAGADGLARLWDISGQYTHGNLTGHRGAVRMAKLSVDSAWATSCGDDGTVRIWSVRSRSLETTIGGHSGKVTGVAFSPDGSRVVSVDENGLLSIWSVPEGRFICSIRVMKGLRGVEWSPAQPLICAAGSSGLYLLRYIE